MQTQNNKRYYPNTTEIKESNLAKVSISTRVGRMVRNNVVVLTVQYLQLQIQEIGKHFKNNLLQNAHLDPK